LSGLDGSASRRSTRASASMQLPTPDSEANDDSSLVNSSSIEATSLKIRMNLNSQKRKFIDYSPDLAVHGIVPTKKQRSARSNTVSSINQDDNEDDEYEFSRLPVAAHPAAKITSGRKRKSAFISNSDEEIEKNTADHLDHPTSVAPTVSKTTDRKKRSYKAVTALQEKNEIVEVEPSTIVTPRVSGRKKRRAIIYTDQDDDYNTDLEPEPDSTPISKPAGRKKRASQIPVRGQEEPIIAEATPCLAPVATGRKKRVKPITPPDEQYLENMDPLSFATLATAKPSLRRKSLIVVPTPNQIETLDSENESTVASTGRMDSVSPYLIDAS
jgi:hypothetical protein